MNPFQFIKAEAESLKQRLKLHQSYQAVFAQPQGREVLHDLLREAGMFSTSQTTDPYQTAFNEGKRYIALFVLNRLRMDNLDHVQQLLMEKARDNRDPDDHQHYDDAAPLLT